MKRLPWLGALIIVFHAPQGRAQNVSASSINLTAASPAFSINTSGNALLNAIKTFDTVDIDPNNGQYGSLPVASLPCHQVAQAYVLAQSCLGSQASTAAETYGYSFNLANTDSGTGAPASGRPELRGPTRSSSISAVTSAARTAISGG